jgi:hypothetical protein
VSRSGALGGLAALAAGAALGACGGSNDAAPTASAPPPGTAPSTATAPRATTPAQTTSTATGPSGGATAPTESQPGGGGDEQPVLVPARYTIRNGRLDPPTIRVPAFLRVRVTVSSQDRQDHTLRVAGREIALPAKGTGAATIDGLRAGRYPITEPDGTTVGALEVGGEPGP